jgi:serine/threonine protein phosphatase 1
MQTYAIGDIHGHLDLLQGAHELIAADRAANGGAEAQLVHIGDLVDRGPNSRGVIEYLIAGQAAGQPWVVLKGNHDRMFTNFMADPWARDPGLRAELTWLHPRLGGPDTLASYGLRDAGDRPVDSVHREAQAAVPQAHVAWLEELPTQLLLGSALYVHAGIRPGVDLSAQTEDDLVWIRAGFLEDERDHGALVVHGHTAIAAPRHYGNRLNIDSSAAYGGPLSAVVIEGRDAWLLTPQGRVPVTP